MKPKPNKHNQLNFRGIKNVTLVTVLEGEGTEENPYQEVEYIYDGQTCIGFLMNDAFTNGYLNK